VAQNITLIKTKSTSSSTVKNITDGPVKFQFVNSYWTDNNAPGGVDAGQSSDRTQAQPVIRQEVGPGEGTSILAVVLINRGFVDVTGVTGSLNLPSGFEATVSPDNNNNNHNGSSNSNTALASYNALIKAGQTFVLYFPINVSSSAQVDKQYIASLKLHVLKFEKELQSDSKAQTIHKVVPIIHVKEDNNSQSVINGSKTLNKSKSQSTNKLTPFDFTSRTITVPFRLSGKVILDVIAFPEQQLLNNNSGIQPSSSGSLNQINIINAVPGSATRVGLGIKNEGSAAANGIIINVFGRNQVATSNNNIITPLTSGNFSASSNLVQQNNIIPLVVLGSTTFNVGSVQAGQSKKIETAVLPSNAVGGTLETLTIRIAYDDAYGNKKMTDKIVGVQILPSNPQSALSVSPFSRP
jgi:hypothetical protein